MDSQLNNSIDKQKELQNKIDALEQELKLEDANLKNEMAQVDKKKVELEFHNNELETTYKNLMEEQIFEREMTQKKQLKQIELANKLISELKKENKKYQKRNAKVQDKFHKVSNTSSKILDMNASLSSLHDSTSNVNELYGNKFGSIQEEYDHMRSTNKDMKDKLRNQQDLYWEVAQSRLEHQKGLATILTLIQDHLRASDMDTGTQSSENKERAFQEMAKEITKIAYRVEDETKIEMAALDVKVAGSDIASNTSYTEVTEICSPYLEPAEENNYCNSNDSGTMKPYLEINLVSPRSS